MGFVNLQTSFAPLFLLTRDEIKKAQRLRRCVPLNVLTQGSLHYRLATLGYQKQNPYGVPQFYKKTLRSLFHLKWLSKAEGDGVRQSANILCADLPFEMAIKSIPRWGASSSQILQTSSACVPPPPPPRCGGGGGGGVRLCFPFSIPQSGWG